MEKLKKLLDAGAITKEEYEKAKKKCLSNYSCQNLQYQFSRSSFLFSLSLVSKN
ncbi:MAG: SHOCT domain-containing protein [Candidatus Baldrarchaeia archaeon]